MRYLKIFSLLVKFFQDLELSSIRLYQKTISPDHGILAFLFPVGYCKFYPSCSEYSYRAIQRYGISKGGRKAFYRLIRCNPWTRGGIDDP